MDDQQVGLQEKYIFVDNMSAVSSKFGSVWIGFRYRIVRTCLGGTCHLPLRACHPHNFLTMHYLSYKDSIPAHS